MQLSHRKCAIYTYPIPFSAPSRDICTLSCPNQPITQLSQPSYLSLHCLPIFPSPFTVLLQKEQSLSQLSLPGLLDCSGSEAPKQHSCIQERGPGLRTS